MKFKIRTLHDAKEPVALRSRPTKGGGASLYLDFTVDGERCREFLKLYLVPERTLIDRMQNRETLKAANLAKARRALELQEGRIGVKKKRDEKMTLAGYVRELSESARAQGKREYANTLDKILRWIVEYGRDVTLAGADRDYVLGLVGFMRRGGLADSTLYTYYGNLNSVFNKAWRADKIAENPMAKIDPADRPRKAGVTREYLTLEEVKTLSATPCARPFVKRAFLFSCFTGLRLVDVENLRWEDIRSTDSGLQVEVMQHKTRRMAYIPLSANAQAQLPPRKKKGGVFDLPDRSTLGRVLRRWVEDAGITKHISFHCARHTCATLLVEFGADIYTVSSILGHSNVATTQIYAKIVDASKRRTVDLVPEI